VAVSASSSRTVWVERAAQLVALTGLGISTPLLNILKDGPEFFVNRRVFPFDIVSLVALLVLVPPMVLLLVEAVARLAGARVARLVHGVCVAILTAIVLVPLCASSLALSGEQSVTLAAIGGVLVAICVARFAAAGRWLSFLSVLVAFSVCTFFTSDGVWTLLFPKAASSDDGFTKKSDTPVVMLILDEFPLNGLLNDQLEVDPERFPNFAALQRDSTWFRNAAAVNQFTPIALPAILSGKMPKSLKQLPTVESYPANLFTILARSHAVTGYEPFTRLCPEDVCAKKVRRTSWRGRIKFMLSDLAAVYLNYAVPSDLDLGVPNIDGKWGDFWEETSGDWDAPNFSRGGRVESFRRFINGLRVTGDKPPFIFAHIILPHMPHQFVSSGRMYAPGVIQGYVKDQWSADPALIQFGYQQFLMQLGATDRLLGQFVQKLKELGIYDKALFIVVADHGASFQAHTHRRGDVQHPAFYEDVMSIPLFIKLPGEGSKGVISEKPAQTIDIVPTVLDLLGLDYKLSLDGAPLFSSAFPERSEQKLLVGRIPKKNADEEASRKKHEQEGQIVGYTSPVQMPRATVDWKYTFPGYKTPNPYNPYHIGPYTELLGKPVADFATTSSPSTFQFQSRGGKVDPARALGVVKYDPKTGVCPCNLQGIVEGSDLQAGATIAVAVNGILQGFSRLIPSAAYTGNFAFLVPDKAFVAGDNTVNLFVVEQAGQSGLRFRSLRAK
jgi:hypothetical protein